jgi:UDP-N-acetylmuramoyl-tripeptide--D-alanyl-D-alanine ligase
MFSGPLSQLAEAVQGSWYGEDVVCQGVTTDTRTLQPGVLFVALKGPRFDGHDFIEQAIQGGAAAVLVEQPLVSDFPHIVVAHVEEAFLQLASYWRLQHPAVAVAVTGSCGKTTTRHLLQSMFSMAGETLASCKSYNNHIGVPHTLLQLAPTHQYYIQEIGANHPNEILPLAAAVKPAVAIITNAASAHLDGFGDLNGVAREKGQLLAGLAEDGTAVLSYDDTYYPYWRGLLQGRQQCLTFSVDGPADVMAHDIVLDEAGYPSFVLICPAGEVLVTLRLVGRHNVSNALAAVAAACAVDLPLDVIARGVQQAIGEERRLQRHVGMANSVIFDDSYNANPLSVSSAIDLLSHQLGETFLVFGDMGELGADSERLHREVGEKAKRAGIHHVMCYGNASRATASAFGQKACHFFDQRALLEALLPLLHPKAVVLVKGSFAMNMRHVVTELLPLG